MKTARKFKCLHCNEINWCDFRNRGRQHYCPKVECRRASKAASQRRWLGKAENRDYFRGPENEARVRQWRAAHPGYWRRRGHRKPHVSEPLQDICPSQSADNKKVVTPEISPVPDALQEICAMQPALLVGLIATMTGNELQEDIVAVASSFSTRGQDILRLWPRGSAALYENQTSALPGTGAARAAPI